MLCVYNCIYSIILNIICYIVNIYIWCCYANISSIRVLVSDRKKYIYMENIKIYKYNIYLKYLNIIYHNYKSILYSNHVQLNLLDYTSTHTGCNDSDQDSPVHDSNTSPTHSENELNRYATTEVNMIRKSLTLLKKNIKVILLNILLNIDTDLCANLHTCILETTGHGFNLNIKTCTFLYHATQICICKGVKITYMSIRKEIIIDIQLIKIKLLHYELNIHDCIQHIMSYLNLNTEKSNYNIQVFINNIHINFCNKNSLQCYIHKVKYNSKDTSLYIHNIRCKSFKKYIANITNIQFNCIEHPILNIEEFYAHVYKTTSHKLKLSLDGIISKKKINKSNRLQKHINNDPVCAIYSKTVLSDIIQDLYIQSKMLYTHTSQSTQVDYNITNMCNKIVQNINIHKLYINIKFQPNIQLICHSVQYTQYNHSTYNIVIQSLHMKDIYDTTYIRTKYNNCNYINILFKQHFLNIQVIPLYINIHTSIFKGLIDILESNVNNLKKLLYYDYIKKNYKEYFIHHLFIHSIMLDLTYIPENKSLYKNLFSSTSAYSIFNIINYKNIHLYTKEIDIYYPLHTNYLIKKIIKIWLKDIYAHQLKNIIKGVKYTKKLPKTYDVSAKICKNIKILLHSGIQYLEY